MIWKIIIGALVSVILFGGGRLVWVEWQFDKTKTQLVFALDGLALAEKNVEIETRARISAEASAARDAARVAGTLQDEREIRNVPVTYECASSPAISLALDQLRHRQTTRRASADDTP